MNRPTTDRHRPWFDYVILTVAVFLVLHSRWDWPITYYEDNVETFAASVAGQGDLARRTGFCLLGAYCIIGWFLTKDRLLRTTGWLSALAIFLFAWVVGSLAWSDEIAISATRLFGVVMVVGAVVTSVKRLTPHEVVTWYACSNWLYVLFGILLELRLNAFKVFDMNYRFAGTQHPNGSAAVCFILTLASLALIAKQPRRKIYYIWMLTGSTFLLLTKSRSAVFCFFTTLILYYGFVSFRKTKLLLFLYALALLVFGPVTLDSLDIISIKQMLSLGRVDESREKLNGRLPLWEFQFKELKKHPIIGQGYGSYWTSEQIEYVSHELDWAISQSHSLYIEIALSTGIIGLLAFLILCFGTLLKNIASNRRSFTNEVFFGTSLLAILIDGFTESNAWTLASVMIVATAHAICVVNFRSERRPPVPTRGLERDDSGLALAAAHGS